MANLRSGGLICKRHTLSIDNRRKTGRICALFVVAHISSECEDRVKSTDTR